MRLTLRTLLAYRDGLLSRVDAEEPTTEVDAAEADPIDEEVHLFELPGGLDAAVEEMTEGETIAADAGSGGASSGGGGALRGPGKPVDFFGVEAKASKIAYVVDASHSMEIDKKYRDARLELIYSIRKLDPTQSFVVIFFSNRMRGAFPSEGLSPANNDTFRELEIWSRKVYPRGGTNPWTALHKATETLVYIGSLRKANCCRLGVSRDTVRISSAYRTASAWTALEHCTLPIGRTAAYRF